MKTLYLNEYLFEFQYNKKFHIIQKYQKLLNIKKFYNQKKNFINLQESKSIKI